MSKSKKTDSNLSATELRARSVANWTKYIESVDLSEELGVGSWVKPTGFEDWHFVMFDKTISFHVQTGKSMMRQGYQEAPSGTRLIGVEDQGERVWYLCAPPEVYLARRERKQQAQLARAATINNEFGSTLASIERIGGNTNVTVKKRDITA